MIHFSSLFFTVHEFETSTTTQIHFGEMPTEICKRESAKRRDVKSQVCRHLCCDTTMSYFCHHSHQSACSEKAEWRLKPSLTWFAFESKKKKQTVSQMTALLLLHFLLCLWGQVIFFFFFTSCGLMLNLNKKKKTFLCRNGSSSISHLVLIWDILHTFVTSCGAVVPR